MKRKGIIKSLAYVMLMAVFMTGCGGQYASVERGGSDGIVSGSAVSGGAISGEAVKADTVSEGAIKSADESAEEEQKTVKSEKKYRYSTDTNLYYETWKDAGDSNKAACIMQVRLDGSHKKEILNAGSGYACWVHYVEENWLYYEVGYQDDEEEEYVLYRSPVEKDAEGYDVIRMDRREKLIKEDCGIFSLLPDSSYLLYDNGKDGVVKYDLRKKKRVGKWSYETFSVEQGDDVYFYRIRDYYVMITGGRVYVQEKDTLDWERMDGWAGLDFESVQTTNAVYYTTDDRGTMKKDTNVLVYKCDGTEAESAVTRKGMEKSLKKAKGMGAGDKIDKYLISDIFAQGDRCYIQAELGWYDGKTYRMEYLLLSQGEKEDGLRYEKELTDVMQSHTKSRSGVWADDHFSTPYVKNVVVNDARCVCMLDGNVYLSLYDYEKEEPWMGCYEPSTGRFHIVSEKEARYGSLRRDGIYDEKELYAFFKERYDFWYMGFSISPTKDEEETGQFYENKK